MVVVQEQMGFGSGERPPSLATAAAPMRNVAMSCALQFRHALRRGLAVGGPLTTGKTRPNLQCGGGVSFRVSLETGLQAYKSGAARTDMSVLCL